ncbi:homeodomain-like superfamily protein [Striga asiatica]|uniref:Homeodomain-like superfamily protein n=1 Tax=Striga asiatica TaxID=4170 RepID=A0A5A7QKM6_STRAF|nr:homeodomain-like superfamily protein [Striga asiatica]
MLEGPMVLALTSPTTASLLKKVQDSSNLQEDPAIDANLHQPCRNREHTRSRKATSLPHSHCLQLSPPPSSLSIQHQRRRQSSSWMPSAPSISSMCAAIDFGVQVQAIAIGAVHLFVYRQSNTSGKRTIRHAGHRRRRRFEVRRSKVAENQTGTGRTPMVRDISETTPPASDAVWQRRRILGRSALNADGEVDRDLGIGNGAGEW